MDEPRWACHYQGRAAGVSVGRLAPAHSPWVEYCEPWAPLFPAAVSRVLLTPGELHSSRGEANAARPLVNMGVANAARPLCCPVSQKPW